jgi:hypothetical protein
MFFFVFFFLILTAADAQRSRREMKRTKSERIWEVVTDDTTRALAALFTSKRREISGLQIDMLFLGGVGLLVYSGGYGMLLASRDWRAASFGLLVMVVGAASFITGVALYISYALEKNPYTIRKYERLIEMHKRGRPLPEFYTLRLFPEG